MRPSLAIILCAAACITTGAQAEHRQNASPEETALARNTCSDVMHIRPGFVPFDACVESLSQTLGANAGRPKSTAASYAIARPAETSYSESNPAERRRKEEYACAQLGIESGGFGQCIADLDSALRGTEHSD